MNEDDLKRALEKLTARLERLERRMDIEEAVDKPVAKAAPPLPPPPQPPPPGGLAHVLQRKADARGARQEPPIPGAGVGAGAAPPTTPPVARPSAPAAKPAPVARKPARSGSDVEMMIGSRWLGWVGAIVILVGVGLLVAAGVKAGWWGKLSPPARCWLVAGFGALLVVGGEVVLRRIGRVASVGLFGAGLGVLYLAAFAASTWFSLVGPATSLVLMGVVALGGFAITLRTRFVSIGVLSIVGGYLTPWLLPGPMTQTPGVGMYLTVLLGISLALSLTLPRPFRPLRYVALVGQGLLGVWWAAGAVPGDWMLVLVFIALWWAAMLVEVIIAALRDQSPIGNAVATLVATAWFVTIGCWIMDRSQPLGFDWLGAYTAMVGVVSAAAAAHFGPGFGALRERPRTAIDKLAVALWAQAGVLLVVAAALQFDGYGQSIAWLSIGLASIEIGRQLRSRGVDIFGLIVGGLGVARVVVWDSWQSGLPGTLRDFEPYFFVDGWFILAAVTVLVVHVAGQRFRADQSSGWRPWPVILAAVGTFLWLGLCERNAHELTVTIGWLIGGALLLANERLGRRQRYFEIALVVLAVTAGRWLVIDALGPRLDRAWAAGGTTPLMNPQMGVALVLAALSWPVFGVLRRRAIERQNTQSELSTAAHEGPPTWQLSLVAGAMFLLVAVSFEVDRALAHLEADATWQSPWAGGGLQLRSLWWTALWAFGGFAMVVFGRWRKVSAVATTGWLLLALAAVVWLFIDTLLWRLPRGPASAPVLINLQFAVGTLAAALLALALWVSRAMHQPAEPAAHKQATQEAGVALTAIAVIGLWLGSLEIDRFFADQPMAMQASLSVYWSLYGVMLVLIGFVKRSAPSRYAGLVLLGITLLKVLLVDFATVESFVWRAVSFLVSGLLLVGLAIVYAKFAPRVLETLHGDSAPSTPPRRR